MLSTPVQPDYRICSKWQMTTRNLPVQIYRVDPSLLSVQKTVETSGAPAIIRGYTYSCAEESASIVLHLVRHCLWNPAHYQLFRQNARNLRARRTKLKRFVQRRHRIWRRRAMLVGTVPSTYCQSIQSNVQCESRKERSGGKGEQYGAMGL
jgi:hypothetical protein